MSPHVAWFCGINDLYTWRHGCNEEKAWPVQHGGSFQEIVQRCFGEMDGLLEESVNFAKTIGLVGRDADINVFAQKFLIFKDLFLKRPKQINNI